MIVLMRHAESVHNALGGKWTDDLGLSPRGFEQARALTGSYDLVICSDLLRAVQTLENSQISYKDVFFSGIFHDEIDAQRGNLVVRKLNLLHALQTTAEQFRRLLCILQAWYPRILVIAHDGFLWVLTGRFFANAEQTEFSPRN